MSAQQALRAAVASVLGVTGGLVWLFGPWALVGCCVVTLLVSLLAPERETNSREPADEDVAPPA